MDTENTSVVTTNEGTNEAATEVTAAQTPESGVKETAPAEPSGSADAGTEAEAEGEAKETSAKEPAKAWKTEENARFAEQRRKSEDAMFRTLIGDITNPETGKPFSDRKEWDNWKHRAAVAANAQKNSMTPEAYEEMETRIREQVKQSDPDFLEAQQQLAEYRKREAETVFERDLKSIKKAYPDEKAKDIRELGDDFIRICASGVSPLAAYEAVRAEKARATKPSTGDVKAAPVADKEFYTRDEVARMSADEVHRNYDKIIKSQSKWGS